MKRKANNVKNATTIQKEATIVSNTNLIAKIKTNKGDINIKLFPNETPFTVLNFVNLSKKGYYNNLKFHRVIADFMIQGGCPQGTGMGGPGYNFKDEFVKDLTFDKPGILAMANSGPGTNGSQFFITHIETPWLNHKHTIFGEVVSSKDQDVVNKITQNDIIETIEITGDIEAFLEANKEPLAELNKELAKDFPNLK
ncbi:MAG: peptidylprolyl isomerase [Fusobacteriia bacterium 4572_74]|nr:MAG: peptidylprolyl isomerase [Fusobacteriia bacterium 4572_74]